LTLKLSDAQYERLSAVSAVPLGAPHESAAGSAAHIAGGRPELLLPAKVPVA
jgi:hypothetical protein